MKNRILKRFALLTLAVLLLNKEENTRSIEIRRSGKLLARCVSPAGSIVSVSLHR